MREEMSDEEFKRLDKEVEEWNKLKEDIKSQVDIVTLKNYDKDSIIFRILGIDKKKKKDKIIQVISGASENTFISTFNTMSDYFEKTLRKDYVKIENISVFQNMFGIIKDRIKSQKEEIKRLEKDIIKTKQNIIKSNDYDEQQDLKYSLYGYDDRIKDSKKTIRILEDLFNQLKYDIKSLGKESSS